MKPVKVFSSGGGVQSTAALVLSAQQKIDFPVHVFANVGDRAESSLTIAYVRDVLRPYAESNGIKWVEVCKKNRQGTPVDLLTKTEQSLKSVPLPVRMAGSGAPGNRSCTVDWKIKPVAKFLRSLIPKDVRIHVVKLSKSLDLEKELSGYVLRRIRLFCEKFPVEKREKKIYEMKLFEMQGILYAQHYPILLGKGISIDEAQRAKEETGFEYYRAEYPLISLGLSRMECHEIIKYAGLPPAPKSSCWFCPYQTKAKWQYLRERDPSKFQEAVQLERLLHSRSVGLGRGGCYFTSTGTTKSLFLDQVTSPDHQCDLFHGFDDGECESGYCWT